MRIKRIKKDFQARTIVQYKAHKSPEEPWRYFDTWGDAFNWVIGYTT